MTASPGAVCPQCNHRWDDHVYPEDQGYVTLPDGQRAVVAFVPIWCCNECDCETWITPDFESD